FRYLFNRDRRYTEIMRDSILTGIRVILAEIWEFLFETKFVRQGSFSQLYGASGFQKESTTLG
ncbi:MAG: hypothetical protein J0M11_16220, partial [Anaerolineae bacterium]|nr:hypothetical protein [Anaerolineae bacterium]